jgi:ketosteroid isomerase-like protein
MRATVLYASAEAAEDAFYDALERGDLDSLMSLWTDDADAVCVHPSGSRLVGLPAIRAGYDEILREGGLTIRVADRRTFQSGTISVHNVIEQVVVRSRGGPTVVRIAATNVYAKGPLGWQLLVHHATSGGGGAEPADEPPPAVLH